MRRTLPALILAILASGSFANAASATGPGGWNHLGNGGTPALASLGGQVTALNADAPGLLLVGGSFVNAGGIAAADRIATWNGSSWGALGATPLGNGSVFAIAYSGGKVYAGGNFINAGNHAAADYLAVYDGASWKPFCNATSHAAFSGDGLQVTALQIIGGTLWVGGTFQDANGVGAADYLIGCSLASGTMSWTVSGSDVHQFTGGVYALTADSNGTLYAGGTFSNLDGIAEADRVAAYDGAAWHSLGTTDIGGIVRGLAARGTDVYVSSDGVDIGGNAKADHLVKWNGSSFSSVGSNFAGTNGYFPTSATIYSMTTVGSLLFAAGGWLDADGDPTGDNVAYFDGTVWQPVGSNGAGNGAWNGTGNVIGLFQGQLYAGGSFTSAGGDSMARFAASHSLRLPDASIGASTGGYVGNHVFSPTAAGESKSITIARGSSKYFNIFIRNDGLVPTTFTVKGTGAAPGYKVTYFDVHGANVTTAVRNGTFSTPSLGPDWSISMKMVVKLSASAAATGSFLVTASSTVGTPKDAVKGIVHAN